MIRNQYLWAAVATLAVASAVRAHHSVSMIDIATSHWVAGTVVRYSPVSPHAMIELDERTASGEIVRWTVEGPFPGRLERILSLNGMSGRADFLKPGDAIAVCGFFPKRAGTTPATADARARRHVHGQVIVMPDGRFQSWGPYGKVDQCVRASDQPEAWLRFLAADPLGREHWCVARGLAVAEPTAPNVVHEIDRRLTPSCSQ